MLSIKCLEQFYVKVPCFVVKVNTSINHLLKSGLSRLDHENVFLTWSHSFSYQSYFRQIWICCECLDWEFGYVLRNKNVNLPDFDVNQSRVGHQCSVFWISFQIGLENQEFHFHFLIRTSITITTSFFNFSIFFVKSEDWSHQN